MKLRKRAIPFVKETIKKGVTSDVAGAGVAKNLIMEGSFSHDVDRMVALTISSLFQACQRRNGLHSKSEEVRAG